MSSRADFAYEISVISIDFSALIKVAVYQRGVAEVGYKTVRRLENESKLDEAELACTVNDGIQRSDC